MLPCSGKTISIYIVLREQFPKLKCLKTVVYFRNKTLLHSHEGSMSHAHVCSKMNKWFSLQIRKDTEEKNGVFDFRHKLKETF
jgi:hypothetical protein